MRDQSLVEKHPTRLGWAPQAGWQVTHGVNNIEDAMLAGSLDVAATGRPGFLVLRDRTPGKGGAGALWRNTINPRPRSRADCGPDDRIAVPGTKTSAAVPPQAMVGEQFGIAEYAKLDLLSEPS